MTDGRKGIEAQKRENPDPHEGNTPIPWLVLLIVALALGWAIGYIALSDLGNDARTGDRRTMADLAPKAAAGGTAVDGAQIFAAQCVACHQATGLGLPGVFPPLAGSEWVNGKESVVAQILLHGITGKITVKGAVYQGQMPAYKDKLSDAEIAAVITHIRSSFGNAAGKVDAPLVKAEREASKDRTKPWDGDNDLAKLE